MQASACECMKMYPSVISCSYIFIIYIQLFSMWSLNDLLLGYGEVIQRSSSDCLGLPRNRIQGLMLGNVSTLHNLEDFGWLTFSQLKRSASKHMIRYTYNHIYIYITAGQLRLAYWRTTTWSTLNILNLDHLRMFTICFELVSLTSKMIWDGFLKVCPIR